MNSKHKQRGTKKSARSAISSQRTWFIGRRLGIVIAALLLSVAIMGEIDLQLRGPKSGPLPGWIIEGPQLQGLIASLPSRLPTTYFDNAKTFMIKDSDDAANYTPDGWRSRMGTHYTSYRAKACGSGCFSLQHDIATKSVNLKPGNIALYDDEHWSRTPVAEQKNACGAMQSFVQAAQQQGLTTIVAPDQNLAQPGVNTYYQGGESENWQTYLRMGLGTCAAKSGSQWYHVMSQPFEAHWCGNPLGACQSSESDLINFVTQAALQARTVNPNIKISDGLSTNPQYFSYFRGSTAFAKIMYRDYADVQHVVNAVWLNVVGQGANSTALYFLSMLGKHADRRSSVLFLQPSTNLRDSEPTAAQPTAFSLASKGTSTTFVSSQTLKGGTTLPAGTGEFQFWTDGTSHDTGKLGVILGYCSGKNCATRVPLTTLHVQIHGGSNGAAVPSGAFTTHTDTMLSLTGTYHMYVRVTTESPAPFSLLYGAKSAPTNLATPVLLPLK